MNIPSSYMKSYLTSLSHGHIRYNQVERYSWCHYWSETQGEVMREFDVEMLIIAGLIDNPNDPNIYILTQKALDIIKPEF